MQNKKIPMRMCSGCKEHLPKKDMVRVVRTPEGEIVLDLTGKKSGRGAYVCRSLACLQKARKIRAFERVLECPIPEDVYNRLEEEMSEGEQ